MKIVIGSVLLAIFATAAYAQVGGGGVLRNSGGAGASSALSGDVKYGMQTADHGCWTRMDGRAKTSFVAAKQTAATAMGIGATLPDTQDKFLIGASGSKALNTAGGSTSIAQNQLPNVALSVSGSTTGVNAVWWYNGTTGNARMPNGGNTFDAQTTSALGVSGSTASINGGVAQQPYNPPYTAVNIFVCLQ